MKTILPQNYPTCKIRRSLLRSSSKWAIFGVFVCMVGCAPKNQELSYEEAVADYERELRAKETYDADKATKKAIKETREATQRSSRDPKERDKYRNIDSE